MQKLKMIALSVLTATAFTFAPSVAKADSDHHYSAKKHYSSHYSHNDRNKHKSQYKHNNRYKKKVVYKNHDHRPQVRYVYYDAPRVVYKPVPRYHSYGGSGLTLSFNFD